MDATVTVSAERDQILVCVVTQPASRVDVVNLEDDRVVPQYWHRQPSRCNTSLRSLR